MVNNLIFGLFFVAICHSNVCGLPKPPLATFALKSSDSFGNTPARTAQCFQEYSPKFTQLNDQYEESYDKCVNLTAVEEALLHQQLQQDIENIQNAAKVTTFNFDNCSTDTDSLYDIFQCLYNATGLAIQNDNEVRILSRSKMEYVQIKEQYIAYNQTVCTENCFQQYNDKSMKLNFDLEQCLAGNNVVTAATTTVKPDVPVNSTTETDTTTKEAEAAPAETLAQVFKLF